MKKKLNLTTFVKDSFGRQKMSKIKGGDGNCTCYCSSDAMTNTTNEESFWHSCDMCQDHLRVR
jgi:hypothetical protein